MVRNMLPNPRHPTAAAQRKQHEKLSRPFRPPGLAAFKHDKQEGRSQRGTGHQKGAALGYSATKGWIEGTTKPQVAQREDRSRHGTAGATTQFKSPLISRDARELSSSIRLTPTIQMLERRLQILKRAIKVKEDNQEDLLQGLVTKWTEAGQAIAWEMWAIVKDNVHDGLGDSSSAISGKRSFRECWGWEMGHDKRYKEEDNLHPNSGIADNGVEEPDTTGRVDLMKVLDEDEDPDRPHDTLGTMLRQLGIDPQTLGWDDEEEIFKEVTGEV